MKSLFIVLIVIGTIFSNLSCQKSHLADTIPPLSIESKEKIKVSSKETDKTKWIAPIYLGLKLGESTKTEVKSLFGEPTYEGVPEENAFLNEREGEIEMEYRDLPSVDGVIVITLGKKSLVLKAVTFYPNNPKSREEIVAEFGSDFFEVASHESMCIKPNSQIGSNFKHLNEYPIALVYPNKGMYISIQEQNLIAHIGYSFKCFDK
jgi:hypothetical protein